MCEHGHGWCLTTWLVESPSAFLSLREKKVKQRNRRLDKTNQHLRPQILSYTRTTCNSEILQHTEHKHVERDAGNHANNETWCCLGRRNEHTQTVLNHSTHYISIPTRCWLLAYSWLNSFEGCEQNYGLQPTVLCWSYNYKVSNNAWKV